MGNNLTIKTTHKTIDSMSWGTLSDLPGSLPFFLWEEPEYGARHVQKSGMWAIGKSGRVQVG